MGAGDIAAVLPAWNGLAAALRAYLRKLVPDQEVDDLLQDCFVRALEGLDSLRDGAPLGPWGFRIARNLAIDHLRAAGHASLEADPNSGDAGGADAEDERAVERAVAGWLAGFVSRLPQEYSETLRLTDLDGLPYATVAERLGLSVSGVKSRVQRGRVLLRDKLVACCSFEFDGQGRVFDYRRNDAEGCDGGECGDASGLALPERS